MNNLDKQYQALLQDILDKYEAKGQIDALEFCKEKNISFQCLCKKSDIWKNWYCERNKKVKNE